MQFAAAFQALGYQLDNQRQDWSAEKHDGVCISLWSKEIDWTTMVMDTRLHAKDYIIWGHKPGNRKRSLHARRALDEFDGWVDVVKIDGIPGEGYGTASPWSATERKGLSWQITFLEDESGHFRLEAKERPSSLTG